MLPPLPDLLLPLLLAAVAAAGFAIGSLVTARRQARAQADGGAQPPLSGLSPSRGIGRGLQGRHGPRRDQHEPQAAAAQAAPPHPGPRSAHRTPALPYAADLLLVDDSAVARTKLQRLFEPAGYRVQLAQDGVEALALLERGRYGLMITDLEMPNMDGVTLIHTCLSRPPLAAMPMIAISGHDSLRAKFDECHDICGVHRKPWVDDILLSHVATLVDVRRVPGGAALH